MSFLEVYYDRMTDAQRERAIDLLRAEHPLALSPDGAEDTELWSIRPLKPMPVRPA